MDSFNKQTGGIKKDKRKSSVTKNIDKKRKKKNEKTTKDSNLRQVLLLLLLVRVANNLVDAQVAAIFPKRMSKSGKI